MAWCGVIHSVGGPTKAVHTPKRPRPGLSADKSDIERSPSRFEMFQSHYRLVFAERGGAHHDDHPVRGVVGSLSLGRGVGGRRVAAVAFGDSTEEGRRWIGLDAHDLAAQFQVAVRLVRIVA